MTRLTLLTSAQTLRRRLPLFVVTAILLFDRAPCSLAQSTTATAESPATVTSPSAKKPSSDESPLEKAEQLYRTGKIEAAIQEYNAIVRTEQGTQVALAYAGLVRVYLKQKNPAEAFSAAAKAVELAPTSDAVRVAQGEAYFRQGKLAEAEHEFTALVRANSKEPRAYLGLSRIYRAASHYKHAKLAIDRAYELDPTDPDIRKAWIHTLSLKDRLKALREYLASETNDDSEQQHGLEEQLMVLQNEAQLATHPCRVTTKATQMETRLDQLTDGPSRLRGFGLSVKLNGVSSRLLLDTGASGILVHRKIAEQAGIKPLVQTDLKGIGDKGAAAGYIGYADSVKIGNLEFQNCYVGVIDKGSVLGDDGLIGPDIFSEFLIDIDFPHAKFRLNQLPPRPDEATAAAAPPSRLSPAGFYDRYIAPEMKSFTPVFRFGHQLLIPTRVNDLAPKLFLIDTGAFSNTISPSAAREVTKVWSDPDVLVKGLSGSVNRVFRADKLTLQFGQFRQNNLDIIAFDTKGVSDATGTEVSGMLGFTMLRMLEIKIDYRDGLVDFIYPGH